MATMAYDPMKVSLTVDGWIVTGFSDGGMIKVTRNSDAVTPLVGVQGDVVYSESADETGVMTVSVLSTSEAFRKLSRLARERKEFSVLLSDVNADTQVQISGNRCRVQKIPDINRGKTAESADIAIYIPKVEER